MAGRMMSLYGNQTWALITTSGITDKRTERKSEKRKKNKYQPMGFEFVHRLDGIYDVEGRVWEGASVRFTKMFLSF